MTDLYIVKPVVRLPQRRGSDSFREDNTEDQQICDGDRQPEERLKPDQYANGCLASDETLYVKDLSRRVNSQEILITLKSCNPKSVHLEQAGSMNTGAITFAKNEDADQAHALYNGVAFEDGSRLHLYFTNGRQEPEPSAIVLQVKNLAADVTSSEVYSLFRVFGPLGFCTIVSDEPNVEIRGSALVQFYEQEDADIAESEMDGKEHRGKTLSVQPMASTALQVPNSAIHLNENTNMATPKESNEAATVYAYQPTDRQGNIPNAGQDMFGDMHTVTIDFTNLYIKNLDLNIKSSDLFNLFRKFGRIISARVMNNAQTGISKGFGFVSFSKAEEAYMALQEMNGKLILSKHIIVAYHEPKKPRSDRPTPLASNMIGISPPHKLNQYPNAMPAPSVFDPSMPAYSNNDISRQYLPSYPPPPPP